MAYKEEHFDKAGANAIAQAFADANDAIVRGGSKKGRGTARKTGKTPVKKQAGKK
ncbi:MAG: hypothetical protein LIP12_00195 [Clostridiales bacterium]|nr:hypothetical protein [Clostridiales bacterium]